MGNSTGRRGPGYAAIDQSPQLRRLDFRRHDAVRGNRREALFACGRSAYGHWPDQPIDGDGGCAQRDLVGCFVKTSNDAAVRSVGGVVEEVSGGAGVCAGIAVMVIL